MIIDKRDRGWKQMSAMGCLFVLGVLMSAVVVFFWAAASARKRAENACQATDDT